MLGKFAAVVHLEPGVASCSGGHLEVAIGMCREIARFGVESNGGKGDGVISGTLQCGARLWGHNMVDCGESIQRCAQRSGRRPITERPFGSVEDHLG